MIPKVYQLFHPILTLLEEKNHKRKTATEALIKQLCLSEEEKKQKIKSGLNLFENRVGWAFTFLTKSEYIELSSEKATYKITELGRDALKTSKETGKEIDEQFLKNNSPNYLKNWQVIEIEKPFSERKNKEEFDKNSEDSAFNLEEELEKNQEEFDIRLLEEIRSMTWQNFEDFCANLLEKMGYGVAAKRKIRSHDGGIDGEILEDELGLKGKIYLQAKQWKSGSKVGSKDMKEFLYNISGKKGVFITTSEFSNEAKQEAANFKEGFIALVDHKELVRLCKKYQHHCQRKTLEIFRLI